jgi:hypothetical protein
MLVRLKIAALLLEFVCSSDPDVTELIVLPDVEVKVAPDPTAIAPAMARVASGTRIFLVRLTLMSFSWIESTGG